MNGQVSLQSADNYEGDTDAKKVDQPLFVLDYLVC